MMTNDQVALLCAAIRRGNHAFSAETVIKDAEKFAKALNKGLAPMTSWNDVECTCGGAPHDPDCVALK